MAEKILLIDDDIDTLRLVGLMLQRQGFEVQVASNGPQALGMAKADPPNLIVLDVMMPEMDGYEVARNLRADPATGEIPIIMFTAKGDVDDKVAGFEAGVDDYLTKPTQPRELIAHIRAVLARTSKRTAPLGPADSRAHLIAVLAARGGLGVTSVALNLGITLREDTKKDVVVAEFRPGQGTIGLELGYQNSESLNRLLKRRPNEISASEIEAELTSHPLGTRLLLSSYQPRDSQLMASVANFEAITRHIAHTARYVIIDLGPALTPVADKVIKLCDEIILVVEPVPQTVTHTKALVNDLFNLGVGEGKITPVLVNRVRSDVQLSWSQVQDQLGLNIAVIFTPAPELAFQASMKNLPIVLQQRDSLTAQQYNKLAERITQRSK